jgi:hypothetical protein
VENNIFELRQRQKTRLLIAMIIVPFSRIRPENYENASYHAI